MNNEKVVSLGKDTAEARSLLKGLIYNKAYFLFIVLGDNPNLVSLASDMAGGPMDPTLVVAIEDYEAVSDILCKLTNAEKKLIDLKKVQAFTTTVGTEIADVIFREEQVNIVRVGKAFQKAFDL